MDKATPMGSGSSKAAAWEFASFQSPGGGLQSSGLAKDVARVVKARPRQAKGLRMQLSLVREPGVVWRSYYFAGASRIAMREDSDTGSEVYYILTDHLGSTSLTVYEDEQGQMQVKARQWYKPWGEVRQVTGQLPTDRTFQGQREPGWGLTHFGARWFDSNLGRFSQADTVIPGMNLSIAWDRYAGLFNNPLKYVDPSGHRPACEDGSNNCDEFHDWILEKRRFMKSPSQLSLSKNGLDFIKEQERFDPNPYNDGLDFRDPFYYDRTGNGTGNCTGCYGHKIHNGPCDGRPEEDRFIAISEVKALVILKDDIKAAEAVVRHNITAPLTQTQYDSLVSLCFNWDCAAHPTKINLINSGSYVAAGLHFLEGPIESNGEIMEGLIKRRYAEAVMFLTGYNVTLPTLEEYLADPLNVSLLP